MILSKLNVKRGLSVIKLICLTSFLPESSELLDSLKPTILRSFHRWRCISFRRWPSSWWRTSPCGWPNWLSLYGIVRTHSLLFCWCGISGNIWPNRSKSGSNWSHIGGWSDRTHWHRSCIHRLKRLLIRLLFRLLIRIENSWVMAWRRLHRTRYPWWRIHGLRCRCRLVTHTVRAS